MAAVWNATSSPEAQVVQDMVNKGAQGTLAGNLWFRMIEPGSGDLVRVHSAMATAKYAKGWLISGKFYENEVDGWGVFPPDVPRTVDQGPINPVGSGGYLHTHVPVDKSQGFNKNPAPPAYPLPIYGGAGSAQWPTPAALA
jgi:hypothetical protein